MEFSNQGSTGAEGTSSITMEENCEECGKCEEDFDCEKKVEQKDCDCEEIVEVVERQEE